MTEAVVQQAIRVAGSLFHNYLGTEHFVLVAIDDGTIDLSRYGLTRDDFVNEMRAMLMSHVSRSTALQSLGINLAETQAAAKSEFGVDLLSRSPQDFTPLTPRMRRILDVARAAAAPSELTSRDVLRAIVDEGANVGVIVLERLSVEVEHLA